MRKARTQLVNRLRRPDQQSEWGMTTAEYAVGTVAACGFAGVLYKVLTSSDVLHLLTSIISKALHLA